MTTNHLAWIHSTLIVLLTGAMIGCAEHQEPGPSPRDAHYDPASCVYPVDQGGMLPQSPVPSRVQTVFFGKKLDFRFLDATAHASIAQTLEFLKDQEMRFYKAPAVSPQNCTCFHNLEELPRDLSHYWKARSTKNSLSTKYVFTGFFLEKGQDDLLSTRSHSVIVLREDSNRWTLLHETLHYFFFLQRQAEKEPTAVELGRSLQHTKYAFDEALAEAQVTLKKKELESMVAAAEAYTAAAIRYLKSFDLEEITIEALLLQKYSQKEITYVPDLRNHAKGYIQAKAEDTTADIEYVKSKIKEALKLAYNVEHRKSEERLVLTLKSVESLQRQVKEVMTEVLATP